MAITLRGTNSNNGTGSADVTVTLPVGTAQNDVVYAAYDEANTTNQNCAMVTADYAELADLYSNDNIDTNLGVYRKVQGATPDTTAVFDAVSGLGIRGVAAAVIVLIGVDTTTPEDATTTTATGTNGPVPDPPSITPVTNGAWVIAIGASTEPDVPTAPADYGNLIEDQNNASSPANIMMATREIATAGSPEDPDTFGSIAGDVADSWSAATVAVRPAAGGGAFTLPLATGAFTLTGQPIAFKRGLVLPLAAGSFALTGQAVALRHGYALALGAGSFALTGNALAFLRGLRLPLAAGAFALTGQAVGLLRGARVTFATGVFDVSGQPVALRFGTSLTLEAGAYALTGQDLAFKRGYVLALGTGAFALTGQAVNLLRGARIALAAGAYTLDGKAVTLAFGGEAAPAARARARRFLANLGSFMSPG